jgi:hypothetical protein
MWSVKKNCEFIFIGRIPISVFSVGLIGLMLFNATFNNISGISSYGSWIYYLCNQCLSPLMLRVRISIRARCTTLCDKVCQWFATGQLFSPGSPVSSTNKTDRNDINEILLKVALNTIITNPRTFLRLQKMSHTIYASNGKQSYSPAHVLMRLYRMDNSLVCLQSERRR